MYTNFKILCSQINLFLYCICLNIILKKIFPILSVQRSVFSSRDFFVVYVFIAFTCSRCDLFGHMLWKTNFFFFQCSGNCPV